MEHRKNPIIEIVQWDGNADTANTFIGEDYTIDWEYNSQKGSGVIIHNLEGYILANVEDWIIKDVKGRFYSCNLDSFEAIYKAIDVST